MILISDVDSKKIKVRFPKKANFPEKIIYYSITDDGFEYSCGDVKKLIKCPRYQSRVIIYFDILIKKGEYGFTVDDIFYQGQRITGNTIKFPNMNMVSTLSEDEHKRERDFLDNIKSGVLKNKPKNCEEFELLLDLISAKGIK